MMGPLAGGIGGEGGAPGIPGLPGFPGLPGLDEPPGEHPGGSSSGL
jgi:hypothetical protein